METVTAYENLRGLVYTPFYLGLAEGLFRAAGIDLQAKLSPSGEETAAGAAAGRVDVSWGGPIRVMAEHDTDPAAKLICFGLAVARDPFLLIGPTPDPTFTIDKLAGCKLAVATTAPTPWILLQEDIRRAGIDPAAVDREDAVDPDVALDRLQSGAADYVLAFEPWGTTAEAQGRGAVVSAGARRGPLAFTSFYAASDFVETRPATAKALVAGLALCLERVRSIPPEEAAALIKPWFEDVDPALLAGSIGRYQRLGLWPATPEITVDGFVRLKSAMLSDSYINSDTPFERLVAIV